jgi:hypothetical protein
MQCGSGPHRYCTCGSSLIPPKSTFHTKPHTTSMKTLTMSVKGFCHGFYTELTVFQVFLCHQVYISPPTNSDLQMNTIDLDWKDHNFFTTDVTTIWKFGSHMLKCILDLDWKDHNFFTTDVTTIWKFGSHMLKCILGYSFLLKGCGTSTTSCSNRKFRPVNTVTHMISIDKSQYWLAHGDCKF